MGALSKRKGKRGEREVAALYREAGFDARRGQQHRGGPGSPDVIVEDLPLLHVEVKRTERFNLYDAIEQAKRDAGDHQFPVVHHRRGQKKPGERAFPWVVVMAWEDFEPLLREAAGILMRGSAASDSTTREAALNECDEYDRLLAAGDFDDAMKALSRASDLTEWDDPNAPKGDGEEPF